jgi:hypothetical protein
MGVGRVAVGLSNKMSSGRTPDMWLGISAPAPSQIGGEVAEKIRFLPLRSPHLFSPPTTSTEMLHPFQPLSSRGPCIEGA